MELQFIFKLICNNCEYFLQPCTSLVDFEIKTTHVNNIIEICGFIDNADIGTPAAISRHLVLPVAGPHETSILENFENMETDDDSHDDGKVPSFCVLLHGALKVPVFIQIVNYCITVKLFFS